LTLEASADMELLPEPAMPLSDTEKTVALVAPVPTAAASRKASAFEAVAALTGGVSSVQLTVQSVALPPAISALAGVPSHIWEQILGMVGCDRACANAALGLLSNAELRVGELGDPILWAKLARQLWGPAAEAVDEHRPAPLRFMDLATGIDEALDLWALLEGGMSSEGAVREIESRQPRLVRRQATQGCAAAVLGASVGLVAVSQRDAEVRLFTGQLSRLPPLRTRGKPVEALAIEPGGERLAVGASDGQVSVYSVTDPEEMPARVHRVVTREGPATFAGLHFVSSGQLAVAARGEAHAALFDTEVRGPPVVESNSSRSPADDASLLTLAALGAEGSESLLLLDTAGCARIWDVRAPQPAATLDLATEAIAAAADPARWSFVVASSVALHWGDLRAQRAVTLPAAVLATRGSADPPLLGFGPRGSILACWASQQAVSACIFAGSGAPVAVCAGEARVVPLAACRTTRSGPLLLSLAKPTASRRWDFELCAVGVRATAPLQMVSSRARPEKATPPLAPALLPRRHAGRGPTRDGHRRLRS